MLKTILYFEKIDELKAYRLLSTTSVDVRTLDEVKDLSDSGLSSVNLARLVLSLRFIKVFQSSILLYVSAATKKSASSSTAFSASQDE